MSRNGIMHYRKIIIPLSRHGIPPHVLVWGIETARQHSCPIEVHHCWTPTVTVLGPPGGMTVPALAHDQSPSQFATDLMNTAVQSIHSVAPDLKVTGRLLIGNIAPTLIAEVDSHDLMIIGPKLHGHMGNFHLSTTTKALLKKTRCQVVVIPPSAKNYTGPFQGHIVVPLIDSPEVFSAIQLAFTEAVQHHWPIAFIHPYQKSSSTPGKDVLMPHDQYAFISKAIGLWQKRYPKVALRRTYRYGSPHRVLQYAASGARALVLSRCFPHQRYSRLLSLVELIIHDAACPVILTAPLTTTATSSTSCLAPSALSQGGVHA